MSEWITDRGPTDDDAYYVTSTEGIVFITNGHDVEVALYHDVAIGTPWMPIVPPEPYVKPKRWVVREYVASRQYFVVEANSFDAPTIYALPTREAAERIAAIYEEVMP